MKPLSRIAIALIVVFVGWKFFLFLFPNDQTRIQRKLNRLESLVSYAPSTSPLAHLAAAGSIQEMFDPKAEVHIRAESQTWNLTGRDEIRSAVLSSRQQEPAGLEVTMDDPLFESGEAGGIVSIVTVTVQRGDQLEPMVRILEMHWQKGERSQWLIRRIKTRGQLEWRE